MNTVYKNPKYYEIAFAFRDIKAEVEVIEECCRRFAERPVRRLLELASGNSPHMTELVRRGYHYTGIDINEEMIAYSRDKARGIQDQVDLRCGDMFDFTLEEPVDFAMILLGSLCAADSAQLVQHFDCVAAALAPGGLYLLDWCIQFDSLDTQSDKGDDTSWEMEADGVKVATTVTWHVVNKIEQTYRETITLDVDDHGRKLEFKEEYVRRGIFPQEFLCLIERHPAFEFVGWWNNWDLKQPLVDQKEIGRPIALLRRA